MRKVVLLITILFLAIACSENNVTPQTLTSKRDQAIAAAVSRQDPNRINLVTKFILHQQYNAASPLLKETVAIDQATGKMSLAYSVISTIKKNASSREDCGSISGGWLLMNDGCWHHGTLITACSGSSLFVIDANPYTDNYIGNEPMCMSQDEFDSIA